MHLRSPRWRGQRHGLVAAAATLALAAAACGGSSGGSATAGSGGAGGGQGTIKLGNLESLSGAGQSVGVPQDNAVKLAVDQINANGGVKIGSKSYKIDLITADDKSDPTAGVTAVQKLINSDGVHYMVGSLSSAVTGAYIPVVKDRNDFVSIVVGAALEGITDNKPIFRPRVTLSQYTNAVINYVKSKGYKKVALLTDQKHSGFVQQTEPLKKGLQAEGVQVTADQSYTFGDTQFGSQLTAILRDKPDLINMRGYPSDLANAIKQARQLGYQGPILTTSGFTNKDVTDAQAQSAMNGVTEIFSPLASDLIDGGKNADRVKAFEDAYEKRFGQPSGGTSLSAYDGVYIWAKALQDAGTVSDVPAVRTALENLKVSEVPDLLELIVPQQNDQIFKDHQSYFTLVIREWKNNGFQPIGFISGAAGS